MKDFSLSTALQMCTSGSWKGGSKLSHLQKNDAEVDVHPDGLWAQLFK